MELEPKITKGLRDRISFGISAKLGGWLSGDGTHRQNEVVCLLVLISCLKSGWLTSAIPSSGVLTSCYFAIFPPFLAQCLMDPCFL